MRVRSRPMLWLGVSTAAGAAGGLVMGAGFRAAMRLAALAEGQQPVFTVGGTVFLLIAGAAFGMVAGLIYGGVRRRLPGSAPSRGLTVGTFLLLVVGALLFASSDGEARTLGNGWVNLATFGGSLLIMGLVIEGAWGRIERKRDVALRAGSGVVAGSIAGAATGLGLAAVGLTRWSTTSPGEALAMLGPLVLFGLLGLILGSLAGLALGLLGVTRRPRGRVLSAATLVGLWLLMALTAGEEGPRGSDRGAEILLIVSVVLGVFSVWTALLTDRVLARVRTLDPEPVGREIALGVNPERQSHHTSWSTTP